MDVSIEQSIEVTASPARAWELVSTSQGLSSWFVSAEIEPGSAGSVTLRFGPGAEGTMPIRRWEPPRRIRFGAAQGEPGRAHDFEVSETATGGSVVNVIDDGLDMAHADAARGAWAGYLNQLKRVADT